MRNVPTKKKCQLGMGNFSKKYSKFWARKALNSDRTVDVLTSGICKLHLEKEKSRKKTGSESARNLPKEIGLNIRI